MINIAIVDDEKTFIQMYEKVIMGFFGKQGFKCKINTFTDSTAFQKETEKSDYNLIFLDIDMPDISGIQIASELYQRNRNTTLIFVSNHSNFVFEAFRYSAYRFIRKENLYSDTEEAVSSFCNTIKTKANYITLDLDSQKDVRIDLSKVKYFFSIRHDIYFLNGSKTADRLAIRTYTLDDLENTLKEKGFIRIHRTYLLNYLYVYQIHNEKVLLKDKSELPLSRGRYDSVKRVYQKMISEGGVL